VTSDNNGNNQLATGQKAKKLSTTKTAAATVRSGNKATTISAPLPHSSDDGINIGGGNGGIDMGDGEGIWALAVVIKVLLPTMVEVLATIN